MSQQKKGVSFHPVRMVTHSLPGNEYSRFDNFDPQKARLNAARQLASKGYNPYGSLLGRSANVTAAAPNYIWKLKPKGGRSRRRSSRRQTRRRR
jgi:hypothetical protein